MDRLRPRKDFFQALSSFHLPSFLFLFLSTASTCRSQAFAAAEAAHNSLLSGPFPSWLGPDNQQPCLDFLPLPSWKKGSQSGWQACALAQTWAFFQAHRWKLLLGTFFQVFHFPPSPAVGPLDGQRTHFTAARLLLCTLFRRARPKESNEAPLPQAPGPLTF